ncbi:MAG: DsbE family thiol:disulfide interchange protein [Gammaproteobacteria bacterium]
MSDAHSSTANPSGANKSKLRRFLPLIFFVLLVVILGIGLTLNPRLVPSPFIGKAAPTFELPLLNADGRFTQEDFKGRITLMNVFASWCFACRQEHEAIKWLAKSGVRVIGFNYKDEVADATSWLQQLGNPYAQVLSDLDGRVGIDWGVYGAPETFVIDHMGVIREKRIGPIDEAYIEDSLMPLLKQLRAEMQGSAT